MHSCRLTVESIVLRCCHKTALSAWMLPCGASVPRSRQSCRLSIISQMALRTWNCSVLLVLAIAGWARAFSHWGTEIHTARWWFHLQCVMWFLWWRRGDQSDESVHMLTQSQGSTDFYFCSALACLTSDQAEHSSSWCLPVFINQNTSFPCPNFVPFAAAWSASIHIYIYTIYKSQTLLLAPQQSKSLFL
jgi:hypothetical protein